MPRDRPKERPKKLVLEFETVRTLDALDTVRGGVLSTSDSLSSCAFKDWR